jgi:branched-chain amino acid transport system permease protein
MTAGVIALLTIGFALVFGILRVINLSHTAFYMLAAYLMLLFTKKIGIGILPSMIATSIVVSIIGICVYVFLIYPVQEHVLTTLVSTFAIALVIQELIYYTFGGNYLAGPTFVSGYVDVLGVRVSFQYLVSIVTLLIVLLIILLFLFKTNYGNAVRATALDPEMASLLGISVKRIFAIASIIATECAVLAGIVAAPLYTLTPYMWLHPLIMVLAATIIGGLGSIKGSIIGAFILGYAITGLILLFPAVSYLQTVIALGTMLIVLMIRPEGLFGIFFEEERL